MNEKIKVASLSMVTNTLLTLGKLGAGLAMNSVSVISEAMHSGIDLMASTIAFISVKESAKPADEHHHYGHGKFENIAGIAEAILIFLAALLIIINAIPKIYRGSEVHALGLGGVIMAVSAVVNFFVSSKLMAVAKKTESPALAADAWHLRTDVYTSLGVLAGILAIKLTGLMILDPIIAIAVALLIIKAALELFLDSMRSLLDVRLPEAEEAEIREILSKYSGAFIEYHELRTRRAGSERYIDLHLVVPPERAINEVHSLCDMIEEEISSKYKGANVLIHSEPCDRNCMSCKQAVDRNGGRNGCEQGQ